MAEAFGIIATVASTCAGLLLILMLKRISELDAKVDKHIQYHLERKDGV